MGKEDFDKDVYLVRLSNEDQVHQLSKSVRSKLKQLDLLLLVMMKKS